MEHPAPSCIIGAKSEGLSQSAHCEVTLCDPSKGLKVVTFAKRVILGDSQNKTRALISSCLNVVCYVSNILRGFPYTYVEVHKVLPLLLFWSFILDYIL